jgi:hypothetical protein
MRRMLAAPALHFLVLGGALLAGDRWLLARAPHAVPAPASIEIDVGRVEVLRATWRVRGGGDLSPLTLSALVDAEIDEEVLLAEARTRGFEESDPVVRARLARNLGFLEADDSNARAGARAQVDEALALGLARGDLVVRRRLIERMRGELAAVGGRALGEAEIAARFARDAARFASPARVRLSHVFLSRDRRGAALAEDAAGLRRQLVGASLDDVSAIALGDPFLLGHTLPLRSQADLARDFGDGFAREAFALEPGVLSEPIASSYGLHLIVVRERRREAPATLDAARAEITAQLTRERAAVALHSEMAALRARYEIRVARVDP